jgi:hypothetical protein
VVWGFERGWSGGGLMMMRGEVAELDIEREGFQRAEAVKECRQRIKVGIGNNK